MTKEQYAADIRNWLAELAIGAKAMMRSVRYEDGSPEIRHRAQCYEQKETERHGIAIHNLREMCKVADIEYTFVPVNGYPECHNIVGHWVCEFNGVKFYTVAYDSAYVQWKEEHNDDRK